MRLLLSLFAIFVNAKQITVSIKFKEKEPLNRKRLKILFIFDAKVKKYNIFGPETINYKPSRISIFYKALESIILMCVLILTGGLMLNATMVTVAG